MSLAGVADVWAPTSGRVVKTALWSVSLGAVAIAWWIAATPIVCALEGGVRVIYPACPSQADRTVAVSLVVVAYALLAVLGTLALGHARSRGLGVIALGAAALAAVPAWLLVAHPMW